LPPSEKLNRDGPHKLLAVDGGGIRGVIAIEVLAALERLLQRELGRGEDFVLGDYFDYVGGTSTGAIIASCIALGMRVDRIRNLYLSNATVMFSRAGVLGRFKHRYTATQLTRRLKQEIGADTLLGSDQLRTLLLLVMRNATTDSPWPVTNNPHARFNQREAPGCNLDLPLWALVRASTAAPTYFPPEVIDVGGQQFIFVDGGVTVYNNPAFLLFLMATAEPYRLGWSVGEERLLLVSIGTGRPTHITQHLRPEGMHLLYHARTVPAGMMSAAAAQQDLLCRMFGRCLIGEPIDLEVGDLIGSAGPVEPPLFTYVRYDAELSREGLERLGLQHIRAQDVARLDAVDHVTELRQIGEAVARQVESAHLANFLDQ
jgi:uncharacterized protein